MPDSVLLHGCSVVDATRSTALTGAAVWVQEERIRAVGTEAEVRAALGAQEHQAIDLGGRYLSPGLINMHTHLSLSLPGPRGAAVKQMNPAQLVLHMAGGAAATLRAGVTTIRCVGEKEHADFALRQAIEAGHVPGPRIFTAGRPISCTGGHGHTSSGALECDGPVGFRSGVRQQIRAGADLIKVMISGGISGQHETITTRQVARDELEAAITTAHEWNRKVTAHAGPAGIIAEAVELGLDCVEHGYELTDEVTAQMAAAGCAYVPTLVVTRCKSFFDELGVPEWMQQRSLGAGPRHIESYRSALAAGVTVMLGSDMPPFWRFEGTSAAVRELEHMAENGLDAPAALAAATLVPATWLGAQDDVGSVEVGKFADLVATAGDPSADVSTYRSTSWVMKGGRVVRDDTRVAGA
ncbi:amidohydrolase family protein [Pseudonocardia sp. MH-G8]|uniref:amidohydrolase family protein n=1 Tax=Pseudonocardia sp. MH-G8 TaxID=1854588 RepID=UPI000B9FE4F9|nr:amidohydrolase family protein [Pseudonocardia sp. MH-G8]OZM76837.1 amidohydrolase [Pseudonocardia sp. MH-G8]